MWRKKGVFETHFFPFILVSCQLLNILLISSLKPFFFFWKWANAKWITANISFFGEGLPHPTPSQPRQRWLEQLLWTTAFQSIDTRLKDLRERKNWTLRICPAFVQTINEKDTGLLCSQQSPLNKQRLSDFWFFLRCWFFSHYEKCKEVTV